MARFIEVPWELASNGSAIIAFDKVAGVLVRKEHSDNPREVTATVYLEGGHLINLAGESAREFLKAWRERP